MTFTSFHEHSCHIFRKLNIFQLDYLKSYHIAVFMYRFNNSLLPSAFDAFFSKVSEIHHYNTRSAVKQSYYLPKARANYGKFNIRFQGPKIWNSIDDKIKVVSLSQFREIKIKTTLSFAVLILAIILYFVTSILLFRSSYSNTCLCVCVYLCTCLCLYSLICSHIVPCTINLFNYLTESGFLALLTYQLFQEVSTPLLVNWLI